MKKPDWMSSRVVAWALYDFANSAFATTILAVIFNVYFARSVTPAEGLLIFGQTLKGETVWSFTVSASMVITFLLAPFLGAVADQRGTKKKLLGIHWIIGCLATGALTFVAPGDVVPAIVFFLLANAAFAGSNALYNAFLPELCPPSLLGRVSGFGWALGYVGGGLCLALNLLMIQKPALFGIPTRDFWPVRACLGSVGVWWFVFGVPFFLGTREEKKQGGPLSMGAAAAAAFGRLKDTFSHMKRYGNLLRFLAAYVVFNDGIETIILMASLFGAKELGMEPGELILCFLMIQAVAFLGALVFGKMADSLRHKKTLFITLGIYLAAVLWAARITTAREFWILGVVVGLVLGGSQAASRSLMAFLTPPEKSAEFFAFFGVVGKLTAVFGPLVFGIVSQMAGLRAGVLSLAGFFILGGILLIFVEEKEPAAS